MPTPKKSYKTENVTGNYPREKKPLRKNKERSDLENYINGRFRLLRLDADVTSKEFGEMIGVNESYIKAVEQQRYTPTHDVIYKAARKFNKDINWFYGWKEKTPE